MRLLTGSADSHAAQQGRGLSQLGSQAVQDGGGLLSPAGSDWQAGQVVQDAPDGSGCLGQ